DVAKRAVAVAVVDDVGQGVELLGRADLRRLGRRPGAARVVPFGERPVDVMRHIQIEVTVAVEVAPGGAGAPGVVEQAGAPPDLDEPAVALVLKELQTTVAGHQQVSETIAVEIGGATTVRVKRRL